MAESARESERLARWECAEHGNDAIAYVPPGPPACKFVTDAGVCSELPAEVVYARFDVASKAYRRVERERDEARAALERARSEEAVERVAAQLYKTWGSGSWGGVAKLERGPWLDEARELLRAAGGET